MTGFWRHADLPVDASASEKDTASIIKAGFSPEGGNNVHIY
jgi:hypothetical protein